MGTAHQEEGAYCLSQRAARPSQQQPGMARDHPHQQLPPEITADLLQGPNVIMLCAINTACHHPDVTRS